MAGGILPVWKKDIFYYCYRKEPYLPIKIPQLSMKREMLYLLIEMCDSYLGLDF